MAATARSVKWCFLLCCRKSVSNSLIFWAKRDIYQLTISWFPSSPSSSPLRSVLFLHHFSSFLTKMIVGSYSLRRFLCHAPLQAVWCAGFCTILCPIQYVFCCVSKASNHVPYVLVYTCVLYQCVTTDCLSSVIGRGIRKRTEDPTLFYCLLFAHFCFLASGQAVVTDVVLYPPRFLPSTFFAHRVQNSHCSSIFIEYC